MSAAKFGPNSSSNEVEYLYTERPKDDICQLCARSLATLTIEEREDHYAIHFAQDEQTATGSMTGLDRPKNWSINLTGGGAQQQQEMYFTLLDSDPDCAPGVRNLQRWIEEAWSEGYDKIGAEQLRHRLYGTSKWIGTGEIYVAFTYKGIPTTLVDFPKSKDGSKKDTADTLLQWIVGYFDTAPEMAPTPSGSQSNAYDLLRSASPVTVTSLMPLILQHKGHSRTIVGYEVTKNGATNLLIFDPAKAPKSDLRRAALQAHDRMRARRQPTLSVTNQSTPGSSSSLVTLTHRRFRSKILKPLKRVLGGSGNNREPIIIDSDDEGATRQAKRARGSSQESTDDDEIEILVREVMGEPERARRQEPHRDEETEGGLWPEERELDPSKVVNHFRVNIGRLSKHDEYQVLYFPLTEPLTDFQKRQRVVVTSERVVP
ncbi:hypothetical protein FRB96_000097 [Tulasnella sp. 330]|nr:hypothetical protein FRB96_000097 [Tulasnella sp. 330]